VHYFQDQKKKRTRALRRGLLFSLHCCSSSCSRCSGLKTRLMGQSIIHHSHLKMTTATTGSAAKKPTKKNLLLLRIHLPPKLFDLVLMACLMTTITINSTNDTSHYQDKRNDKKGESIKANVVRASIKQRRRSFTAARMHVTRHLLEVRQVDVVWPRRLLHEKSKKRAGNQHLTNITPP
jgi:hypothetical protein